MLSVLLPGLWLVDSCVLPPPSGWKPFQRASDSVPDTSSIPDGGAVYDGGHPQRPPVEPHVHGECGHVHPFLFSISSSSACLETRVSLQSFLKHKDAKPLRDVLASNPSRFLPLLVPAGPTATVRPGSPSTSTARLDLQFQAIKVSHEEAHLETHARGALRSQLCRRMCATLPSADHQHHRQA